MLSGFCKYPRIIYLTGLLRFWNAENLKEALIRKQDGKKNICVGIRAAVRLKKMWQQTNKDILLEFTESQMDIDDAESY